MMEDTVSVEEAAQILGVSRQKVIQFLNDDILPAHGTPRVVADPIARTETRRIGRQALEAFRERLQKAAPR